MNRQVITVHPDGTLSGLQVKPGKGIDLRQFGTANIQRASEVLFNEDRQQWFVEVRKGRYAGKQITWTMLAMATGQVFKMKANDPVAHFDEYDDAVNAEIAVLDHIRLTEGASAL